MTSTSTETAPHDTAAEHQSGCCSSQGHAHAHEPAKMEQSSCCSVSVSAEPAIVILTDKAASAVKRIIQEQQRPGENPAEKIYLRLSVRGGGCSGLQPKLDLDTVIDTKKDDLWEIHGVPVVIDRRSQMYLTGATVDYHDDLNRSGFSIQNPQAKTTCGCGSSFSM